METLLAAAAKGLALSPKGWVCYLGNKIVQDLVTSWKCQQNHEHHPICRHNHGTACCALLQRKLVVCIRTRLYLKAKVGLLEHAKLRFSANRMLHHICQPGNFHLSKHLWQV